MDALSGNTSAKVEAFLKAFEHPMLGSGVQIALGPFKFLYQFMDPKWRESCRTIHLFTDRYVKRALDNRRRSGSKTLSDVESIAPYRQPYCLLFGIAEQTEDQLKLRNEILQAMMAAQETTAALISNVFFLLSRNQPVYQRLREEIFTLSETDLSQEKLQNMPYLSNVLKESVCFPLIIGRNRPN